MANNEDPFLSPGNPGSAVPQPGMGDPNSYTPPPPGTTPPAYGSTPIPPPPPPGFAGPPAGYPAAPSKYGQQGAYVTPMGTYGVSADNAKNTYGILALVFPFVGFAVIGIVMGHLGLAAVKKGQANNYGVAIAGLLISYIFTFLGLAWIIFVIALSASTASYTSYTSYDDRVAAVERDLEAIAREVDASWALGVAPSVWVDGDEYVIGNARVPVTAEKPDVRVFGDSATTWCVQLGTAFTVTSSYSAQGGYEKWLDCDTATMFYEDDEPSSNSAPTPTGEAYQNATVVSLYDLEVGDCMLDPYEAAVYSEATDSYTLWDVYLVPCDELHYGEVSAVADFSDATFPGIDVVRERLESICRTEFENYIEIEYANSAFYFDYFYPTSSSWASGDREYTCLVYSTSDFEGSLKGAAK